VVAHWERADSTITFLTEEQIEFALKFKLDIELGTKADKESAFGKTTLDDIINILVVLDLYLTTTSNTDNGTNSATNITSTSTSTSSTNLKAEEQLEQSPSMPICTADTTSTSNINSASTATT